jgi:hypothetical protein
MRRDARGCRPPSSDRDGGKTGSAAQNLPRFSSTATTVPEDRAREGRDFAGESELAGLPDLFPLDPRGELT